MVRQHQIQGEIPEVDDGALHQGHRPLDDVLELADVARPRVGLEGDEGLRGDAADGLLELVGILPDEVLHEQRDVPPPVPERGHRDRHHVQPIVEVLAESLLAHGLLEILVSRGDDPHVHLEALRSADPLELPLLEHAEELGLEVGLEGGDLVQEERAAVSQLELPLFPLMGAREGAPLVTEEFGFNERVRDGSGIHGDEWHVAPRSLAVDGVGDELLARAALPGDQDRRRRARDLGDQAEEGLHRRVLAHDPVEVTRPGKLGPKKHDLPFQRAPVERSTDHVQDFVLVERLGQVLEGAELHGGDRRTYGGDRGHEDDVELLIERLHPFQDFDAIHPGQADVEEDQIHVGGAHDVEGLETIGDIKDLVLVLQDHAERLAEAEVVVHDQNDGAQAPCVLEWRETHPSSASLSGAATELLRSSVTGLRTPKGEARPIRGRLR